MSFRRLTITILVSLCVLAGWLVFVGGSALAATPEPCPNVQVRTGFDVQLPDCRAYELVTPPGTAPDFEDVPELGNVTQGQMPGEARGVMASANGERLMYTTNYPPVGSPSDGPYMLARREVNGWTSEDLIPPQSPNHELVCYNAFTLALSADFSKSVLADGYFQPKCGTDEPALVPGEPGGIQNLFVRNSETDTSRLVDVTPEGSSLANAWFQAGSEDLGHIVFDERAKLTPEAPLENDDLYEWSNGQVRLVTFLPDGEPVAGSLANATEAETLFTYNGPEMFTHAVSSDGSRVFFYAEGKLYVRKNAYEEQSAIGPQGECAEVAKACTVQVDASRTGGVGGGGRFMWASTDGSRVFFMDDASAGLTSNTVPGSGENLYEYNVETADLTDLTPTAGPAVLGVSGISEDGDYVYFIAEGELTNQENGEKAKAEAGQPNLYLWHAGTTTYIATLAGFDHSCEAPNNSEKPCGGDWLDWELKELTARVSPNGQFIGFNSVKSLTGYNNIPVQPGECRGEEGETEACQEIFLYSAGQNQLSCVSCAPNGARPIAPAGIYVSDHDWGGGAAPIRTPGYLQRNVLNNGLVFFTTREPLVATDTNGKYDAYEYEEGQLHPLSTTTSNVNSFFYETDLAGNNVFVITAMQLPSGKPEAVYSIYDARVDGGFQEPANLTECSEEDCKGSFSPPPAISAPTSATFVGAGNPVLTPAVVHKATTTAKKKKKKKRHKKLGSRRGAGRARNVKGQSGAKIEKRARTKRAAALNRGGKK